ncbi:MAG: potassium transporter TrkG [Flavobacteriaceae bacterium]|nr:potassium transporter TrkG [Flavobacteriaceae bacterium]MDG1912719.1 potassium transporter TrkG [Flavobacteriaceae bacterium]
MGILLLFNGSLMLLSSLTSFIFKDGVTFELTLSAFLVLSTGALMMLFGRQHNKQIQKREGYLIVSLGWVLMSLSGTLPYLLTAAIPDFTAAFFETMSGYTTTGASILNDIEIIPKGVLFWRSTTHWIGGMGIIVLAIAILPFLGIGGTQLFTAEAPGPGGDKLHPRITDTAKRLWLIYVAYTLLETFLLYFAGMSFFDAINHSMSTLSTGGFSTKNASIAFWNDQPLIQYIIIFFMFLAGMNFVLSYYAFTRKFQKIIRDEEFKVYFSFILIFTVLTTLIVLNKEQYSLVQGIALVSQVESIFRDALFQVVSVITTTGFVSTDFTLWTPFLTIVFFGLMFLGGSSGSTSGGVKVVRHLLMIKGGFLEFKRALHPNAIIQARYNKKIVGDSISYNILGFFILYMLSFIIGALGFGLLDIDFESTIGLAASTLGNVGPALGDFGPSHNYEALPDAGKWWASFLMLLGRLELFTVLILFTPFLWRKH